jgi:hypothetical protein
MLIPIPQFLILVASSNFVLNKTIYTVNPDRICKSNIQLHTSCMCYKAEIWSFLTYFFYPINGSEPHQCNSSLHVDLIRKYQAQEDKYNSMISWLYFSLAWLDLR